MKYASNGHRHDRGSPFTNAHPSASGGDEPLLREIPERARSRPANHAASERRPRPSRLPRQTRSTTRPPTPSPGQNDLVGARHGDRLRRTAGDRLCRVRLGGLPSLLLRPLERQRLGASRDHARRGAPSAPMAWSRTTRAGSPSTTRTPSIVYLSPPGQWDLRGRDPNVTPDAGVFPGRP